VSVAELAHRLCHCFAVRTNYLGKLLVCVAHNGGRNVCRDIVCLAR
jgi:hypothetical protein